MNSSDARPAIGVIFHPSFPPETLPDYARRAEAAEFDELWLWDDCFLPGALTSAALALSATRRLKVGIGLLPVKAYNPLFLAMEITTLERAFPGRILPGFGYGVDHWMAQIGATPKPSIKALRETVTAVRRLLAGEMVTMHSDQVNLEEVQMHLTPAGVPPLYVGAMRERSLRLAGSIGEGSILTGMSSPAYMRWAMSHIRAGMDEAGRTQHRVAAYVNVKVSQDGAAARSAARQALAEWLPWADVHTEALGIAQEAAVFYQKYGKTGAQHIPDAWLDEFAAAGTPQQVTGALQRWLDTGIDSLVLQPLNGDPDCLDEYIRDLMPALKPALSR